MAIRGDVIDRHCKERLEQQKAKILEDAKALPVTCGTFRRDSVCYSVVQNLTQRISELLRAAFAVEESFQSRISSVRYLFEALIQSALLAQEPEYGHKIYFGAVSKAVEKCRLCLEKLGKEQALLESYINREKAIFSELRDAADSAAVIDRSDALIDELDRELTIFLDSADFNGLDYLAHLLTSAVHPGYLQRLSQLESVRTDTLNRFFCRSRTP